MLELLVDVDGRPLSRYGCDGVVCATPTGSTAYAFSAGGPVVWPEVEALLLVPISAHALFSRPLVTAPTSTIAITVDPYTSFAVLCCDGRRVFDLPPGARVTVRRGALPVRVVRLRAAAVHRPAGGEVRAAGGRLARAIDADGLTGVPDRRRGQLSVGTRLLSRPVLEELRITGLGVIDDTTLPLTRGHERHHRRDRCRQDDGGDRPGLLFGGRADAGRVRADPGRAVVEGRLRLAGAAGDAVHDPDRRRRRRARRRRHAAAEPHGHGRGPFAGARRRPDACRCRCSAEVGEQVVAVHGQSDQLRLLRPAEQRAALDRFAGAGAREAAGRATARRSRRWRAVADDLADRRRNARERTQEADLLRLGLDEITRVDPQPGEDEELRAEAQRLEHAEGLRTAAAAGRTRRWPAAARRRRRAGRDGAARHRPAHAGGAGRRRPGARASWPPGSRRRPRWSATSPSSCRPTSARSTPTRPGWQAIYERRAALRGADPQVRRRRRRRDRLGRAGPDPAGRAGHLRRAARGAGPGAAAAGRRGRPSWPAGCPRRGARRRAGSPSRSPSSWPGWPCRTPGSRSRCCRAPAGGGEPTLTVDGAEVRRRRRTAPTRSSCGCWPTRARRRCRCRRAPPAASCPG